MPEIIDPAPHHNVQLAVPFFGVTNMEASLRFYVDGLGFQIRRKWIVHEKIRWCWLELGAAAVMLQEFRKVPEGKLGVGMSVCFQCEDALAIYRDARSHGLSTETPFVGNNMWVTGLTDPNGYSLSFESPTDTPEETVLAE